MNSEHKNKSLTLLGVYRFSSHPTTSRTKPQTLWESRERSERNNRSAGRSLTTLFYCSEPSAERNVTFVQEETNYLCNVIIQLAYDNTWLQRRCMTTSEAHHQHLLLVTIMIIKHFRGFRATRTSSSASERASETAHICPRGLVVTYDILTDTMACWVESPESFDFFFFLSLLHVPGVKQSIEKSTIHSSPGWC